MNLRLCARLSCSTHKMRCLQTGRSDKCSQRRGLHSTAASPNIRHSASCWADNWNICEAQVVRVPERCGHLEAGAICSADDVHTLQQLFVLGLQCAAEC